MQTLLRKEIIPNWDKDMAAHLCKAGRCTSGLSFHD